MDLKTLLLTIMMKMPAPYGSTEPLEDRAFRLDTIATAIAAESEPSAGWLPSWTQKDRALLALVVTYHESGRWRLDVHKGTKRGDHGRSVCLGQIMSGPWIDHELWLSLPGTSSRNTTNCIRTVLAYLARARRMCASGLWPSANAAARTFTLYGTGNTCGPIELGRVRGRHFERLRYIR